MVLNGHHCTYIWHKYEVSKLCTFRVVLNFTENAVSHPSWCYISLSWSTAFFKWENCLSSVLAFLLIANLLATVSLSVPNMHFFRLGSMDSCSKQYVWKLDDFFNSSYSYGLLLLNNSVTTETSVFLKKLWCCGEFISVMFVIPSYLWWKKYRCLTNYQILSCT